MGGHELFLCPGDHISRRVHLAENSKFSSVVDVSALPGAQRAQSRSERGRTSGRHVVTRRRPPPDAAIIAGLPAADVELFRVPKLFLRRAAWRDSIGTKTSAINARDCRWRRERRTKPSVEGGTLNAQSHGLRGMGEAGRCMRDF